MKKRGRHVPPWRAWALERRSDGMIYVRLYPARRLARATRLYRAGKVRVVRVTIHEVRRRAKR